MLLLFGQNLHMVHSEEHRQKLNSISMYFPTAILPQGTVYVLQFLLNLHTRYSSNISDKKKFPKRPIGLIAHLRNSSNQWTQFAQNYD